MTRANAPSVFEDIGIQFITENRGALQKYRIEHLVERANLILGNHFESVTEYAYGAINKVVDQNLKGDLSATACNSVCDKIFDALFKVDIQSEESVHEWETHERLSIAVLVLVEKVQLSNPVQAADQNGHILNLAERLCQAACFSYMEHLFPGRYTDLERLAELAMLTGFGAFTQAFDGQIPDAFKPLMRSVLLQPGFLDHAKAGITEIQSVGKRGVASAGGYARNAVFAPFKEFAIDRYKRSCHEWANPSEASKRIYFELRDQFGIERIANHDITDQTVYKWIRPFSPRKKAAMK